MKDVANLTVNQIHIFSPDVLPISLLSTEKNIALLRDAFTFKQALIADREDGPVLTLLAGEFTNEGDSSTILQLELQSRRITFSITSNSQVAAALLDRIRATLRDIGKQRIGDLSTPILSVEETTCVATLEVHFHSIFSTHYRHFLDQASGRLSSQVAKATASVANLFARVAYEPVDTKLQQVMGITLSDKFLVIEPRAGTSLDEKRYFTHSPTDSETHLALLADFENAFKKVS